MSQLVRSALTVGLALSVLLPGARATAQGIALPALSNGRVLMLGEPDVIDEYAAQIRFSVEGAFVTGLFDAERTRQSLDDAPHSLGFSWDASFDFASVAEIGARLRFAWQRSDTYERIGPEWLVLSGRYLAVRPEPDGGGLSLAVGLGLGQRLLEEGGRLIEANVVLGTELGAHGAWEGELGGLLTVSGPVDPRHAAITTGPVWRPNDWFSLAIDLQGRYGRVDAGLDDFWDVTGGLRLAAELESGHELGLSGFRTIYGESIDERTAGLFSWRYRWQTDGGLLRLDTDEQPFSGQGTIDAREPDVESDEESDVEDEEGAETEPASEIEEEQAEEEQAEEEQAEEEQAEEEQAEEPTADESTADEPTADEPTADEADPGTPDED